MKLQSFKQEDLDSLILDVNGLTGRDWEELRQIALAFIANNLFNGDSFKCTIAAASIFLTHGHGLKEDDIFEGWVQ